MNHLHQSYSDVMNMPTIERRFFLETLHQQNIQMNERSKNVVNKSNGTRITKHTGESVKSIYNEYSNQL